MFLGLHLSVLRGHSGSGVGMVNKDLECLVEKSQLDAVNWMCTPQYENVNRNLTSSQIIMGHTRAPTFANTVQARNAQPFWFPNSDDSRSIMMTHNGHINNHNELTRDIKDFNHPVDSAHICRAFAEYGSVVTLEKARGGFALAWYDDLTNKFYMASNGKRNLALAFNKEKTRAYYASEAGMLRLALDRVEIEYDEIFEMPTMKILSWDIDGAKIVEDPAVDFRDPPSYQTQGYWTGGSGTKNNTESGTVDRAEKLFLYTYTGQELLAYGREEIKRKRWKKHIYHGYLPAYAPSLPGVEIKINGVASTDWERWQILGNSSGIPCKVNQVTTEHTDGGKKKLYSCSVLKDAADKEVERVESMRRLVPRGQLTGPRPPLVLAAPDKRKVPGPEGEEITFQAWREMANERCSDCEGNILDIDVGKVSFLPINDRVEDGQLQTTYLMVCPLCTKDQDQKEKTQKHLDAAQGGPSGVTH